VGAGVGDNRDGNTAVVPAIAAAVHNGTAALSRADAAFSVADNKGVLSSAGNAEIDATDVEISHRLPELSLSLSTKIPPAIVFISVHCVSDSVANSNLGSTLVNVATAHSAVDKNDSSPTDEVETGVIVVAIATTVVSDATETESLQNNAADAKCVAGDEQADIVPCTDDDITTDTVAAFCSVTDNAETDAVVAIEAVHKVSAAESMADKVKDPDSAADSNEGGEQVEAAVCRDDRVARSVTDLVGAFCSDSVSVTSMTPASTSNHAELRGTTADL